MVAQNLQHKIFSTGQRSGLKQFYTDVRSRSVWLCEPLETEDYVVQPSEDVSPPKWHLGHTSWFFETFLVQAFHPHFKVHHAGYGFIFNSYYESIGERSPRNARGTLSRPTVKDVYAYRAAIDEQMLAILETVSEPQWPEFERLTVLGLNHEEQHQELLVMDIKSIFAQNPLRPVYRASQNDTAHHTDAPRGRTDTAFASGLYTIGHATEDGFAFDNESPPHQVFLEGFTLENRLVTNRDYLAFIEDGGYTKPALWLSDGWATVQREGWHAPLYWEKLPEKSGGLWHETTLSGFHEISSLLDVPVCHVSHYEADAFATWSGKRLPSEAEWEVAAMISGAQVTDGNFLERAAFHPKPAHHDAPATLQLFGDVWEWTASAYLPYPRYRRESGALGEYNGKFMSGQMVLRGGSCATPAKHIRRTYRNFFQPDKRWAFSGIRLAGDF
ncbi:MAG: ergothioneine biosynthesis protein EgtB [Rhizobacter sp.]|nr:ergothioneine biosynthesis protein EgtB [Chlorobiales bacterium]